MLGQLNWFLRWMLVSARDDLANAVVAGPDDILDAPGRVKPVRFPLALLRDKDRFVGPAIVPAHPHLALIPNDHLLELKNLVHPQRPAGKLRVRTAAAAAAAAAAAVFQQPLC